MRERRSRGKNEKREEKERKKERGKRKCATVLLVL
jgi:hypothetical protein